MVERNIPTGHEGQLVGDYRLLRLLGGGGFGEVYLAEQTHNHSYVAVKILQARLAHGEDLKAFINEARTFRLKHPNIVPLLDFGVTRENVPYLVMEYAPKGTLRERHPLGTQVTLPTVVSYVNQMASALQYAHDQYIIHRDVKPENMLVGANGEVLLTDFGIAAVVHNSYTLSEQPEGIGGTASYMAPEQIEGKPRPASDQYALGVLTYEWLSGKRPFQGTPMEIMMQHMAALPTPLYQQTPLLTAEVERVVFTALAKDPRQRFDSIRAFAMAFTQAVQQCQTFPVSSQSFSPPLPPYPSPAQLPSSPPFPTMQSTVETAPLASNRQFNNAQHPRAALPTDWDPSMKPQAPLRKAPSWGRNILFLVVVLLILGGTTFTYITLSNSRPKPYGMMAIAPKIAVTPTVPDPNTDPSGFYTWITSKQRASVQSFADPGLGWDTSNDCAFTNNGHYQVSAQPAAGVIIFVSCMAEKTNYVNFVFQVDMTMIKSETAGLIFRQNTVLNADYLFEVNSNNTYYLNTSTPSLSPQNGIVPSSPYSGQTTNTLTVIAHDHDIYLFINRHFLTHTSDATSGSGQIGFFVDAQPTDQGGAVVDFSNLKIWTLA